MRYKEAQRIFRGARCKMPLNLQFFAEGGESGGDGGGAAGGSSGGAEGGDAGGEADSGKAVSFDDFLKDPKNQAEFDRRVNKALETSKTKYEADVNARIEAAKTEAEKMAKMNAEQKAQYEREKQEEALKKREEDLTKRELIVEAKAQLEAKGLPVELANVLNYSDAESCTKSIEATEKAFQKAVEAAVEKKLTGGNPPKKGGTKATYTMEQIKAMTPEEINANWEAVQASMAAAKP